MPSLLSALLPLPLALLAAGPAAAAAQERAPQRVGDWTVMVSKDGSGCFLNRAYGGPGHMLLLVGLDADGGDRVTVLNDNWSIAAGDKLRLDFRVADQRYADHFAVGFVAGPQRGFVTQFDPAFLDALAAGASLDIDRGKVPVARLSLDGSADALTALRACVADARAPAAATAADDGVPLDPFAQPGRHKRKNRK